MIKILLISLYILMPLLVIFVERKNPDEAAVWVIILLGFPFGGLILYMIFGNTFFIKLSSYLREKKLKKSINIKKPNSIVVDKTSLSNTVKDVMEFNYRYNDSLITSYNSISVYTNGIDHYTNLFNDIMNAKRYIFIEFYTIHNDIVGAKLIEALVKKAKEGVKIIIMCDYIANLSVSNKFYKELKVLGVKVVRIKPYLTHFRSHRKIVTIDHNISYIGGMNIGKQYINRNPRKCPWRDTQVRIEGPATLMLDEYFMDDFICASKKRDFNETIKYFKNVKSEEYKNTNNLCQFVKGGVDNDLESIKMTYLSMIRSAKKNIRIQSPYFIPDESILDALKTALLTGVDIEIMTPGVKASFYLDPVTNYYLGELLKYGAKVYKYKGYIHAKTITIDDEIVCIGSVNMDIRSLRVDDEICGIFYTKEFVKEYISIFNEDIKNTNEYTLENFNNRKLKEKILAGIFLPFAPLL